MDSRMNQLEVIVQGGATADKVLAENNRKLAVLCIDTWLDICLEAALVSDGAMDYAKRSLHRPFILGFDCSCNLINLLRYDDHTELVELLEKRLNLQARKWPFQVTVRKDQYNCFAYEFQIAPAH